jgi:hypothetical protein
MGPICAQSAGLAICQVRQAPEQRRSAARDFFASMAIGIMIAASVRATG